MPTHIVHKISPVGEDGVIRCFQHNLPAPRFTSRTEDNPGRGFYTCVKPQDDPDRCTFWFWEDAPQLRSRRHTTTSTSSADPKPTFQPPPMSPSSPSRPVKPKTPKTPSTTLSPEQKKRRYELIVEATSGGALPTPPKPAIPVALSHKDAAGRQRTSLPKTADANPFVSSQPASKAPSAFKLPPVRGSELAGPVESSGSSTTSTAEFYDALADPTMVAGSALEEDDPSSQRTVRPQRMPGELITPPSSSRGPSRTGMLGSSSGSGTNESAGMVNGGSSLAPFVDRKGKGRARSPPEDFTMSERRGRPPSSSSPQASRPVSLTNEALPVPSSSPGAPGTSPAQHWAPRIRELTLELAGVGHGITEQSKRFLNVAQYVEDLEGERDQLESHLQQVEHEVERLQRQKVALAKTNKAKDEQIAQLKARIAELER